MGMHIVVDDDLVAELDSRAGPRGRTEFVVRALRRALDDERRWDGIRAALSHPIADTGHDWDEDPAAWVRDLRRADPSRVG